MGVVKLDYSKMGNNEKRERIFKLFDSGLGVPEVIEETKLGYSTLWRYSKLWKTYRGVKVNKEPEDVKSRKEKAFKLFDEGKSQGDVSNELGIAKSTSCVYYADWKNVRGIVKEKEEEKKNKEIEVRKSDIVEGNVIDKSDLDRDTRNKSKIHNFAEEYEGNVFAKFFAGKELESSEDIVIECSSNTKRGDVIELGEGITFTSGKDTFVLQEGFKGDGPLDIGYGEEGYNIKRGDIIYVYSNPNSDSFEKDKGVLSTTKTVNFKSLGEGRPAVVIQNDTGNANSPTIIVAFMSTVIKKIDLPTHMVVKYNCLGKVSMIMAEQVRTISKYYTKKMGSLDSVDMETLDMVISRSFGIRRAAVSNVDLTSLRKDLANQKEFIEKCTLELNTSKSRIENLNKEIESKNDTIEELRKSKNEMGITINDLRNTIDTMGDNIEVLKENQVVEETYDKVNMLKTLVIKSLGGKYVDYSLDEDTITIERECRTFTMKREEFRETIKEIEYILNNL